MPPQALIFDVDGTLAETEDAHRDAFNTAFAQAGLTWHWDAALYGALLDVTGGKERMRHYAATIGAPVPDDVIARLHAAKTAFYVTRMTQGGLSLRPGIARLIHAARAAGTALAIATTTSLPNVESLLAATLGDGAPGWFAVIGAGDMVAAKKPAPDVFALVVDRLRLDPGDCVAFEDSQNGLIAARGAGLPTIVTVSRYSAHHDFAGALSVLDHLGEPDRPCRSLAGLAPSGQCVDLATLADWLG